MAVEPKRHNVPTAVAVLALVATFVAGLVIWRITRSDEVGEQPSAKSEFTPIGADVSVKDGAGPQGLTATADPAVHSPFTEVVQPLGPAVHITPGGQLAQPITLQFRLNQPITNVNDVIIATSESGAPDSWELKRPDSVSPDGQYAYVTTSHLSFWETLKRDTNALIDVVKDEARKIINSATSDLTTTAQQSKCANEEQAKQNYTITADGSPVHWCVGIENNQLTLKMVNKRRYPLLVKPTNMKTTSIPGLKFRLDQLARWGSGQNSVLFPFEEAHYGLTTDQGVAKITTEFDGWAQSLYQLQFAVETLISILNRFGAGAGTVSNGAITKSGLDHVVELMDKFLQVGDCASLLAEDVNVGELLDRCFDPADILEVFGWKGVLIAPAMVAAPVVSFFVSEFNALGDQFSGRDRQTITIERKKHNPLKDMAGEWHVHGGQLTVNADGTGTDSWNAGTCSPYKPNVTISMCTGNATLTFRAEGDQLIGTFTKVWHVSSSGQLPPGYNPDWGPKVGDSFRMWRHDAHTLKTEAVKGEYFPGNPYLCDGVDNPSIKLCGA